MTQLLVYIFSTTTLAIQFREFVRIIQSSRCFYIIDCKLELIVNRIADCGWGKKMQMRWGMMVMAGDTELL